jgi:phage terminase Nu1 subunit (DNA packaging protein)
MSAKATYPVNVIAKLLDLSIRRVYQLTNEGVIPKVEKGRYELVPAVQGYIRYLRDRAIGADALPDESARASRARLIKAQAEAQEMENARVRGDLLSVPVIERAWGEMAAAFKARVLSIPGKAAPQVVSCNSIAEVKAVLEQMIFEALDELSRGDYPRGEEGDQESSPGNAKDRRSAANLNRKRMGRPVPEAIAGV